MEIVCQWIGTEETVILRMGMAKTEVTTEMGPREAAATDMEEVHRLHDMKEEETIGRGLVRMTALGGEGGPPPWTVTETSLYHTSDSLFLRLFRIYVLVRSILHLVHWLGWMVYDDLFP